MDKWDWTGRCWRLGLDVGGLKVRRHGQNAHPSRQRMNIWIDTPPALESPRGGFAYYPASDTATEFRGVLSKPICSVSSFAPRQSSCL